MYVLISSQWPRGIRLGSLAVRLLGLLRSNPAGVVNVCFLVLGFAARDLCVGLITLPE